MKKLLFILSIAILFVSCQGQSNKTDATSEASEPIKTIAGIDFEAKLLALKNPQLIDVRTPEEYAVEHLQNATNIDWNGTDFVEEAKKLDQSKPVFVYCKVGGRSSQAADKLSELGFKEIYNLDGGIMKWKGKKTTNTAIIPKGLSNAEFEKLINSDKKVIINFSAKWCGPCKKMEPYLLKMQEELKGKIALIRLDADENKSLLESMKIEGLPVILIYENGKETWRNLGYLSEEDLRKKL